MLQPGALIRNLVADDAHDTPVSLDAWRGKRLVLYFYPKNDTPGCTMEACSFRDNLASLRERGAEVVGVSPDPVSSHAAFTRKYSLPFTLLSDTDGSLAEAFGTSVEQQWAGKTFKSVKRATFLIDEKGIVRKVWEQVDPRNHVQQVVEALDELARNDELQTRLQEVRKAFSHPAESPFAKAGESAAERTSRVPASPMAAPVSRNEVLSVLDSLRPYLQADGGDVELVDITDGTVKVRLTGACGTCPSSTITLRMGLEKQLKDRIPGVTGVEAVF